MPRHLLPLLIVVAVACAFAPAGADARGGWSTPVDLGPATTATVKREAVVAAGAGGDVSVLITTRGVGDATLSLRRTRANGALGRPLVLARSTRSLQAGPLAVDRDGRTTAVWSLRDARPVGPGTTSRRLHAVRVGATTRGRELRVVDLTEGRRSTSSPRFVPGLPGPALVWSGNEADGLLTARWGAGRDPELGAVTVPSGLDAGVVLAGTPSGWVVGASATPGAIRVTGSEDGARSFDAPVDLPAAGTVSSLDLVLSADRRGAALIGWTEYDLAARRARMRVATLARGSAPGPTQTLGTGEIRSPAVVADRDGGGFAAWIASTNSEVAAHGPARVVRVSADGGAEPVRLAGGSPHATALTLVTDGAGGALMVWVDGSVLRSQQLRADGTTGAVVTLEHDLSFSVPTFPSLRFGPTAATVAAGRTAAVVFERRGRLLLRVRR